MKKNLSLLKLLFNLIWLTTIYTTQLFATDVSGEQSGKWNQDRSPYLIKDDIIIPSGETLIIEPGVIVKFANFNKIRVEGTLLAEGTSADQIVFTSDKDFEFSEAVQTEPEKTSPNFDDWDMIEFVDDSEQQPSKISHCIIRYCANIIQCKNAAPILQRIIIVDCERNQLLINGKFRSITQGRENDILISKSDYSITSEAESEKSVSIGEVFEAEEFTFGEIKVISAAKRYQALIEAPAAISIITNEDIRQSGAMNIPELLRTVPGLDIMGVSAANYCISARGFNRPTSSKMLVMIDGRVTYINFVGITLWSSFPIALEEIKQIEVIRGPGSALYGANALCGVINIITKTPEEMNGNILALSAGEQETYIGSVIHSGVKGKIAYRTSFGWDQCNQWENEVPFTDNLGKEIQRANITLDYRVGETAKITAFSGYNVGAHDIASESAGISDVPFIKFGTVGLRYDQPNLMFRVYGNLMRMGRKDAPDTTTMDQNEGKIKDDIYDIELHHFIDFSARNKILWGLNYRMSRCDAIMIGKHRQNIYAGFLQDEYRPFDNLALTVGVRYDQHPLTKGQFSPRGSMVFSPGKNHTLRLSYGTAFKNPNYTESFCFMVINLAPGINYQLLGNKALKPTQIISYEIGYNLGLGRLRANLDLFFNQMKDFIDFKTIEYFPAGPPFYGAPKTDKVLNSGKAEAYGGEAGLNFYITNSLTALCNYSYQKITDKSNDPHFRVRTESFPKHKANFGIRWKMKSGLLANLLVHYVDKTQWKMIPSWNAGGVAAAYSIVNARIGYQFFDRKAELAVAAYNLFNNKHYEYPAIKLGRKIIGSFHYYF